MRPLAAGGDGEPVFFGAPELNRSDPRVLAQSYLTYLATRNLRQDAAHVIAIAGIGLWFVAAWPDWFPSTVREDVLIVWLFLVAAGIILRIVEWRRRVEFHRCMNAQTPESADDPLARTR